MTIYVDDMYTVAMGQYRRMLMSHMIADTEDELHRMADRIGVARKWYQGDHYDVSLMKRSAAIRYGARPITMRLLAFMSFRRLADGRLLDLRTASALLRSGQIGHDLGVFG